MIKAQTYDEISHKHYILFSAFIMSIVGINISRKET